MTRSAAGVAGGRRVSRRRPPATIDAAWEAHHRGSHDVALATCEALVGRGIRSAELFYMLGLQRSILGQTRAALDSFDAAVTLAPSLVELRMVRGATRMKVGRSAEALEDFSEVMKLDPGHPKAALFAAQAALAIGNHQEVRRYASQVIDRDPECQQAFSYLGTALSEMGRSRDAMTILRRALELDPRDLKARIELGEVLLRLKDMARAGEAFVEAIRLDPRSPRPHVGLAKCLARAGYRDQAMKKLRSAIAVTGGSPVIRVALGNLLRDSGDVEGARQCFSEVIASHPGIVAARYNLARLDFECFRFQDAWKHMGARWESQKTAARAVASSRPLWTGSREGGPLLIWGEQGIGDQILFATILPDLIALPREKIVALDRRLIPLLERSIADHRFRFVDRDRPPDESEYAEHIAIGDLGQFFRNRFEDFRNTEKPFLRGDPDRIARYRAELRPTPGKLVVGLAWRSKNVKVADAKSLGGQELYDLVAGADCRFVNLQYGDVRSEIASLQGVGVDLVEVAGLDVMDDIDGLAAAIMACDVVLTTSNSTAHIAGALGKRTLLLVPNGRGQFWYWQPVGEGSIWYPSVRLLRQERPGDWAAPIEAARRILRESKP